MVRNGIFGYEMDMVRNDYNSLRFSSNNINYCSGINPSTPTVAAVSTCLYTPQCAVQQYYYQEISNNPCVSECLFNIKKAFFSHIIARTSYISMR